MNGFFQNMATEWQSIVLMISIISAIVHLIFAGAVAKDAARLSKEGVTIQLVSPITWAFATLVGGVLVAAVYWFMHRVRFK